MFMDPSTEEKSSDFMFMEPSSEEESFDSNELDPLLLRGDDCHNLLYYVIIIMCRSVMSDRRDS